MPEVFGEGLELILVIADSASNMDVVRDTSLQFLDAASTVSDQVFWATPECFAWSGGGELSVSRPQAKCFPYQKSVSGLPRTDVEHEFKALHSFSLIYMRKEPPVDTRFLAITWMLDRALELSDKLQVINSPSSLRAMNEKALIFNFPHKMQEALVSASAEDVLQFASSFGAGKEGVVVKPLDGYGGRGVVQVKQDELSAESMTKLIAASGGGVIVQPFASEVFEGEVRVFCLHGKIISWCLKLPKDGEFLAGTGAGAVIQDYSPTKEEEESVQYVTQALGKRGVEMLGIDMIGGKLSEINITSPRSLFVGEKREEIVGSISDKIKTALGRG